MSALAYNSLKMAAMSGLANMPCIVCDNGTGFVKVGYAGQNFPAYSFASMVGRPILRAEEDVGTIELKDVMCGDEAAAVRHSLDIRYPVRIIISITIYLFFKLHIYF